mgnify:CR=1 FL=1
MKLQPESKKELTRIACGTAICTAALWVAFAALHLVGWVKFDYTVVLGSLIGAAVAIGNFAGICIVCQKVIDEQDEKRRKATLQASYNVRMLLQAVWIIVSIGAPCFQPFASVLPLLFPRVTIYYLQITGKYKPLAPAGPSVDVSVEDDPEPAPEPEAEPRDEGVKRTNGTERRKDPVYHPYRYPPAGRSQDHPDPSHYLDRHGAAFGPGHLAGQQPQAGKCLKAAGRGRVHRGAAGSVRARQHGVSL